MKHVLRFQPFHHPVGDEFVVIGSLQIFGHSLEGHQEAVEILVAVELFDLTQSAGFSVAPSQFDQRCGIDRTFQMQMQLGLGKSDEK